MRLESVPRGETPSREQASGPASIPTSSGAIVSRRLAIIAPHAYPLLTDSRVGGWGGADVQLVGLGRAIERQGWEVVFITLEPQPEDAVSSPPDRVLTTCRWDRGWPGVRYFHPRLTAFLRALSRAGAAIYLLRTASGSVGLVSLYCRMAGRIAVFSSGSDAHVDRRYRDRLNGRDQVLYRYGLRAAHARVVQTRTQLESLRSHFGLAGQVIPNWCEVPPPDETASPRYFLWAGTLRREKQPEAFLEIARRLPDLRFVMIGGRAEDPALYERIRAEVSLLPNIEFRGHCDRGSSLASYADAIALINTSAYEGFANTYLEAWARAVPVLTLHGDPDEVICRERLGYHEADIGSLAERAKRLARSPQERRAMGRAAQAYVERVHDIGRVTSQWLEMFECLTDRRRSPA